MNAPSNRIIQVEIVYVDPDNDKVHIEAHEWTLDPGEVLVGICPVTATPKNGSEKHTSKLAGS